MVMMRESIPMSDVSVDIDGMRILVRSDGRVRLVGDAVAPVEPPSTRSQVPFGGLLRVILPVLIFQLVIFLVGVMLLCHQHATIRSLDRHIPFPSRITHQGGLSR
jgi:hypothetical protein